MFTENANKAIRNITTSDEEISNRDVELKQLNSFLQKNDQGNIENELKNYFKKELSHFKNLSDAGDILIKTILGRVDSLSNAQLISLSAQLEQNKNQSFQSITEMIASKNKNQFLDLEKSDVKNITIQLNEQQSGIQGILEKRLDDRINERYK